MVTALTILMKEKTFRVHRVKHRVVRESDFSD